MSQKSRNSPGLSTVLDLYAIATGSELPLEQWLVHASVIRGDPHSNAARSKWAITKNASLELTHVSTSLGDTISGRFQIHTTAFEDTSRTVSPLAT